MASISGAPSFSGSVPGGPAPGCTTGAPPTVAAGAAPGSPAPVVADGTSDGFLQLFAGMIGESTPSPQSNMQLLPQDLVAPALALGSGEVESVSDTTDPDSDDDDLDEAGALAIAVLLPGLSCLAPTTAGNTVTAGSGEAAPAVTSSRIAIDLAQTAVDELVDDTADRADAAGNFPASSADSTTSTSAQSSTSSAQVHALLATHAARNSDAVPDGMVRSPVGTPQWNDELGAQLTWMTANGREAASLRLSPEHLGPLEIRIAVRDGEASVWFGATNPDTRSALEQSLPRLRELFASQGLVLADAGVSRDAPRNHFKPQTFAGSSRGSSDAGAGQSVTAVTLARAGLIDTYV